MGREPGSLAVSVHLWGEASAVSPGRERQERLLEYAELGVARVMVQGFMGVSDPAALDSLFQDGADVGLLDGAPPVGSVVA